MLVKASQFPLITYVIESIHQPDNKENGRLTGLARGRLYVAGLKAAGTAPFSIDYSDASEIRVTGKAQVNMSDFGIKPPRLLLLSADDLVRIEFELKFKRQE